MLNANAQTSPQTDSGDENPLKLAKLKKLAAIEEAGIDAFPHKFHRTHKAGDVQTKYEGLENGVETEDVVRVAGRIMAYRNNGMFIDLHDATGKIQIFCHKDTLSEDKLKALETLDLGDIIGVEGTIRRTPRGELSVRTKELTLLTKSFLPLPEKYHGLSDIEQRYRQRYVDLIVNDDARSVLRARSKIVTSIRHFMDNMGALEVETPTLHPILGGASAKPFITHYNAVDSQFYLRVAPELYLKRLIIGGFADAVYEIGKNFRNEGVSIKHNPEFTSIEGYHAYMDYNDIMTLIEDLVKFVVQSLHGTYEIQYGEHMIDFGKPWLRRSMTDLVKDATGIDFLAIHSAQEALEAAAKIGVKLDPKLNWGQVVEAVFGERVEHTLIQPTHVTDHPFEISPLSKNHQTEPRLVERFESFVNGWEIANAFTELNDPRVQRERFEAQVSQRDAGDEEAQMLDEDFITALEYGLPPTGGWGMGVDRLTMLLTNSSNIRDVILFPTLKPLK
ncbi:MAG: lysine--tRNA ligase [Micavibrio aeruginosavorus]|uniref:Lysine--tRNA ligase n=1 Tax=Micavibrio aeruginosavorus TaxID=349221 RepID=A0A2W5FQ28_9BACT|nr:MAG: lysine--tRNA ligase [Micavibrio aeruginosavorus]